MGLSCGHGYKGTVMQSFGVYFVVSLNNMFNKQSGLRWFEMLCSHGITVMICAGIPLDFPHSVPIMRKYLSWLCLIIRIRFADHKATFDLTKHITIIHNKNQAPTTVYLLLESTCYSHFPIDRFVAPDYRSHMVHHVNPYCVEFISETKKYLCIFRWLLKMEMVLEVEILPGGILGHIYHAESILLLLMSWLYKEWHNELTHFGLIHWGRVFIGSDNGLLPGWHEAISWANVGKLLIGL